MIRCSPQPSRLFFAPDKRPHLIQFSLLHLAHHHCRGYSLTTRYQGGVHRLKRRRFFLRVEITVVGLTPSTGAVSWRPLPLSTLSTICRLTSGNRPVW